MAVAAGKVIGYMGNTGSSTGRHLHLMIRHFGTLDPRKKERKNLAAWIFDEGHWINTSYLFRGFDDVNSVGGNGKVKTLPLEYLVDDYFIPSGDPDQRTTTITKHGKTDTYGTKITKEQYGHFKMEHRYGVKRVSTYGDSVDVLAKMGASDLPIDQQYLVLRERVRNDFFESTMSRNTGKILIQGLDERVMVGLPYLIYHPVHNNFYYGSVAEVSHRVDNSEGGAYTEISLNNVRSVIAIREMVAMFEDYYDDKYMSRESSNALWAKITGTTLPQKIDNCDINQILDASVESPVRDYFHLLGQRPICTIEQMMNYMYENKKTVATHSNVATEDTKARQWMTPEMHNVVRSIIEYYRTNLVSHDMASMADIPELEENKATEDIDDE